MTCSATARRSSSDDVDPEVCRRLSGGRPDLVASPEVLTCSNTLRGEAEARALSRAVASLMLVRVWSVWRFGMAAKEVGTPSSGAVERHY